MSRQTGRWKLQQARPAVSAQPDVSSQKTQQIVVENDEASEMPKNWENGIRFWSKTVCLH
jgi:hypothetical protein